MAGQRRRIQTGLLGKERPVEGRRRLPDDNPPIVPVSEAPTHLLFQIGSGTVTTIGLAVAESLIIGRADPPGFMPDVDLTYYNALEKGVSRRHAMITRSNNVLYIQDLGSRNQTILNDETLEPQQPYPLNDGDVLMVGALQIVVWYVFDE
jgi:pSer/pThr/pTyr-binding forkhead associated (FHA) protein